ncbi:MAG TPA: copper amine oxidase N-terminal domain-containing protein, partial [Bacillota bacterium]
MFLRFGKRILLGLLLFHLVWLGIFIPGALALEAQAVSAPSVNVELVAGSPRALVNGVEVRLDAPPFIQQGRLLVPLRFLGETLGASVRWDAGRIELHMPGRSVILHVGRKEAIVDGTPVPLDVPPVVTSGRTMVPLRFVAETFAIPVNYDPASGRVRLGAAGEPPIARIEVDRTQIRLGEPLNYQDASTAAEGRTIVRREW